MQTNRPDLPRCMLCGEVAVQLASRTGVFNIHCKNFWLDPDHDHTGTGYYDTLEEAERAWNSYCRCDNKTEDKKDGR